MRLVSWTLAGPGTAPIIDDALRSVIPFVDARLVIQTDPRSWAYGEPEGPNGLITATYWWQWRDSFAAARGAGLSIAEDTGSDWSTMLDTDERVVCPDPAALRAFLVALPEHVVVALAHAADGSHTRERFFRHPCRHKFVGRTHEAFTALQHEQAIIPRELILWTELPKSAEQLRAKFERDVAMLREDIADKPTDGRAWFYLGQSLQGLQRWQEAIDAYRKFAELDTWEGGAWGCYRAAECYLALEQPDRAIDCALVGMARDAGMAELPWIAAVASLQVGRLEQARCWGELARVHGQGSEAERRRVGFRLVRGLTTGPGEVLGAVYGARAEEEARSGRPDELARHRFNMAAAGFKGARDPVWAAIMAAPVDTTPDTPEETAALKEIGNPCPTCGRPPCVPCRADCAGSWQRSGVL